MKYLAFSISLLVLTVSDAADYKTLTSKDGMRQYVGELVLPEQKVAAESQEASIDAVVIKLELINTGMSDAGLFHFAPLKNLERFAYIGTQTTAEPVCCFQGLEQSHQLEFSREQDHGFRQRSRRSFPVWS